MSVYHFQEAQSGAIWTIAKHHKQLNGLNYVELSTYSTRRIISYAENHLLKFDKVKKSYQEEELSYWLQRE